MPKNETPAAGTFIQIVDNLYITLDTDLIRSMLKSIDDPQCPGFLLLDVTTNQPQNRVTYIRNSNLELPYVNIITPEEAIAKQDATHE